MNIGSDIHGHHPLGRMPAALTAALGMLIPLVMVAAPVPIVYAASTSLYISPATATVAQNATVAVAVRLNTGGEPINAVQADLNYDQAQLQFVSIDANGSAFGVTAPSNGGNGKVSIARGNIGEVTGDVLVATVSFKAVAAAGTNEVTFADSSQVVRSTDNINVLTGTVGGKFTLKAAGGGTQPGPVPKPSTASPSSRNASPATPPAATTPGATPPATPSETPVEEGGSPSPMPAGTTYKPSFRPPDSVSDASVAAKVAFWSLSSLAVIAAVALIWRSVLRRHHTIVPAAAGSGFTAQPGAAPYGPPQNDTVLPQSVAPTAEPALTPTSFGPAPSVIAQVQPGVITPTQPLQPPGDDSFMPPLPPPGLPR